MYNICYFSLNLFFLQLRNAYYPFDFLYRAFVLFFFLLYFHFIHVFCFGKEKTFIMIAADEQLFQFLLLRLEIFFLMQ